MLVLAIFVIFRLLISQTRMINDGYKLLEELQAVDKKGH